MIERLAIRELALVEALELELGPGLNVFTGETGAGKSIVLSALALLAGARAPADAIRDGAGEACVEAVLALDAWPALAEALRARELADGGSELIVRRVLARSGRSRAWLGARLTPVSALAELLGEGIEVSSQHASQALLRPELQGRLLDEFAGTTALRGAVAAGLARLREQEREIAALREAAEERLRRADYLGFQLRELDEARIDLAEAAEAAQEQRRLGHAEQLRSGVLTAAAGLAGDPEQPEALGAADLARRAGRALGELARLDPALTPLAERLVAASAELTDLSGDLERYAARCESDPARLAALEARLGELERVKRKYGGSLEAALARREDVARELTALGSSDERMGKLERERGAERARLETDVARLSAERARAAEALARAANRAVRGLALPEARFEVARVPVEPAEGMPCGPAGAETIELRFSANPGEPLRALRSVASGGELSRVFLALRDVLRGASGGRVLVFDEVDAGIGGAVAETVGQRLAALAEHHQVLCITHLPQIAVHADRHFLVEKLVRGGRTRSAVRALDPEGRVREIARMAGGAEVGAATLGHARALLQAARSKGARPRKRL